MNSKDTKPSEAENLLMRCQGVTPSIDSANAWEYRREAIDALSALILSTRPERQIVRDYKDTEEQAYNDALDLWTANLRDKGIRI